MNIKRLLSLAAIATAFVANSQRIAVLSDVHVTPGNMCDSMLRVAVAEINKNDFDLVIVDGDLSNEGSDEQLYNVKSILDAVRHPIFVLPGNHENNWSQSATKTFVDIWGNDRFVTEVDSLVIVGINCGPFMKMGDGHIKQEDLHWLKSTLDERVTPGKRVLSFNHYPLQEDLDNWQDYVRVLEQYPVIGHINGHYHSWKKYKGGDIDAAMVRALDMRDGTYGYTILDITPEWIHVYNKNVGESKPQPKFAWAARTSLKPLKGAEKAEWTSPEGYEVTKVWADSASIFTRLGFDADNVYFGNSLGAARAVGKKDSQLKWSVETGASLFSRPSVLLSGRVAIPYSDGIMIVNPANGKLVKTYKSAEGPYVADGLVTDKAYIQGAYKRLERRNPKNGALVWSYDSIFNYCQAAPVVDGDDVIFGAWDTNLRCLSLKNGKLKWVWNNGKTANMLGPGNVVPVVTDDKVIVVAPDRYMTAVDRRTGRQLWRDNSHRYRESLGHSEDLTRVYAKTMDGELVAVDATTPDFKEIFTVDMGLGYEHAPTVIAERDGVVYAGSRRGIVTAVDPVAKKVIWSLPLGVSEINGIDVDPTTGDIYVSLIEGTIFRIAKKK